MLETSSRPFGVVASGVEQADSSGVTTFFNICCPISAEAGRTGFIPHEYKKRWPAENLTLVAKINENCPECPAG